MSNMTEVLAALNNSDKWHRCGWDDAIRDTKFLVEALEKISICDCYERFGHYCDWRMKLIAKDALSKYRGLVGDVEPKLTGDPKKDNIL